MCNLLVLIEIIVDFKQFDFVGTFSNGLNFRAFIIYMRLYKSLGDLEIYLDKFIGLWIGHNFFDFEQTLMIFIFQKADV